MHANRWVFGEFEFGVALALDVLVTRFPENGVEAEVFALTYETFDDYASA
jgi:hypothetical protein